MVCEVFNNVAPTFIPNLIALNCFQYSLRKDKPVVIPNANTSKLYGLKSFAHGGPRIWNSLPNELRKRENYGELRRLIQRQSLIYKSLKHQRNKLDQRSEVHDHILPLIEKIKHTFRCYSSCDASNNEK